MGTSAGVSGTRRVDMLEISMISNDGQVCVPTQTGRSRCFGVKPETRS